MVKLKWRYLRRRKVWHGSKDNKVEGKCCERRNELGLHAALIDFFFVYLRLVSASILSMRLWQLVTRTIGLDTRLRLEAWSKPGKPNSRHSLLTLPLARVLARNSARWSPHDKLRFLSMLVVSMPLN